MGNVDNDGETGCDDSSIDEGQPSVDEIDGDIDQIEDDVVGDETGSDGESVDEHRVLLAIEDDVVGDATGSGTCPIPPESIMRRFEVPEGATSFSADVDAVSDV